MAQVWFDAIEAIGIGPRSYVHWIRGFPGIGGQTAHYNDPDGDGLEYSIENFFGTAPNAASADIAIGSVNPAQGCFTYTLPQVVLADDLAASYQWSKDMAGEDNGKLKDSFTSWFRNPPISVTVSNPA